MRMFTLFLPRSAGLRKARPHLRPSRLHGLLIFGVDGPDVFPHQALGIVQVVAPLPEDVGGVESGHRLDAVYLVPRAAVLGDPEVLVYDRLRGGTAEAEDDVGLDGLDLALQVGIAGPYLASPRLPGCRRGACQPSPRKAVPWRLRSRLALLRRASAASRDLRSRRPYWCGSSPGRTWCRRRPDGRAPPAVSRGPRHPPRYRKDSPRLLQDASVPTDYSTPHPRVLGSTCSRLNYGPQCRQLCNGREGTNNHRREKLRDMAVMEGADAVAYRLRMGVGGRKSWMRVEAFAWPATKERS